MTSSSEPHDSFVHSCVHFYADTIEFARLSVRFTEGLLAKEVAAAELDPALKALLDARERAPLPIERVRRDLDRCRQWLDGLKPDGGDYEIDISHGRARLVKSAMLLYLGHLRSKRNEFAAKPNLSRHLLTTIDQELTAKEELLALAVFRRASPIALLADELLLGQARGASASVEDNSNLATVQRPRPVILSTIEILDGDLRGRCLDLLEQFRQDGEQSRLDTVVAEAMRILEDRLRIRSGGAATCVGVNLAVHAFGSASPKLILSSTAGEQEGGLALFRGVFAFIRNQVQHRLVNTLTPERTLQIVAMVDYLLFLIESAAENSANGGV